ncbi:GHMP kinase [Sulfodiicoccus acidiphilus]|uniref:phosphomevalonate kinase n=1 Tax=Sulfodiicoccus acidiphilus TaxID=1670455 RepID=A0A348B0H0_9CREN|nr:GHMP kinase [Sulfodiicoccus acidiphilus]BBD71672.1 GHMP kinase [Sulfodiicoccus acidiphilus]GGT86705.1 GHMP kinase [Sulfodiicoccus acidiphilus]
MISAPGKVLWIGSYTVVFGGLAHVIAIDKRVRCEVCESQRPIYETNFGVFEGKGNELIQSVLEEFEREEGKVPPLRVKLMNDREFIRNGRKTGLGSSSAATVALTACIYKYLHGRLDLGEIYVKAQRANWRRQGGIGSGFDVAAAVFGSVVYRTFTDPIKVDSYHEPLKLGDKVSMIVGLSGRPSSTVELVKRFIEGRSKIEPLMKLIDEENQNAINLLKRGKIDAAALHTRLARNILAQAAKTVGVNLNGEMGKVIDEAEENGAYVSLSPGAGGGELYFALGDDLASVEAKWRKRGLTVFYVKEDMGVREE